MGAITATTALTIASVAATAIGAGVSAYGAYQQGQAAQAISNWNAKAQENNARTQLRSMQAQAAVQKAGADNELRLRAAEASARMQNAKAIEQNALTQDAIGRTNLAKRREEFSRMQGEQRAALASSGVVESSGTPLDLLAETAAQIQQDMEEQHFTGELQRRTLFSEAAQERLGGRLALAGATLDRDSSVAEATLRETAGRGAYQAGRREAEITRLTGRAQKRAANIAAGGTLLSGANEGASTYARYRTS